MIGQSGNNLVRFIEGVFEQIDLNVLIFHSLSQNESCLMQFQNSMFYVCIKEKPKRSKNEITSKTFQVRIQNQMYLWYY